MNISSIRAKARQVKSQTPGIHMLFLVPILANIISIAYNVNQRTGYTSNATLNTNQASEIMTSGLFTTGLVITALAGLIFGIVITILLSFFTISAQFTTLDVLRGKREEVNFKDSLRAFNTDIFGKTFATIFMKNLFLFLWGLLSLIGFYITLFALIALFFAYIFGASEPVPAFMTALLVGIVVTIIGLAISIPKHYAYSQVEYILYDKLENNDYTSASAIIKESRHLMKGFKFKRFVLDLSFIGWWILTSFTFGLVGIHVIPYNAIANVIFYEELRQGTLEA